MCDLSEVVQLQSSQWGQLGGGGGAPASAFLRAGHSGPLLEGCGALVSL